MENEDGPEPNAAEGVGAGLADEISRRLTTSDPASALYGSCLDWGTWNRDSRLRRVHAQVPPLTQANEGDPSKPPPRILCEVRTRSALLSRAQTFVTRAFGEEGFFLAGYEMAQPFA